MARTKKTDVLPQQPLDIALFKPFEVSKVKVDFTKLETSDSLAVVEAKLSGVQLAPHKKLLFAMEVELEEVRTKFGSEDIGSLFFTISRWVGVIKPEAEESTPEVEQPAIEPEPEQPLVVDKETGEILATPDTVAMFEAQDQANEARAAKLDGQAEALADAEPTLEEELEKEFDATGADETLAEGGTDQFENDLPAKPELPCSCFATWEDISECRGCKQQDPCRIYTEAGVTV